MDKNREMKNKTKDLFNKVSTLFDRSGPRYFSAFGERLVELSGIREGDKVLDLAAGRGASLFPAAKIAGDSGYVTGIDISEGMVYETAVEIEKLCIKNAKILVMDAENLNFQNETFDCVLCGFGIFFFPDYTKALSEIKRVLKKGGKFGFTTFSRNDNETVWVKEMIQKFSEQDQTLAPSGPEFDIEEGLIKVLSENGFENPQVIYEEKEFIYINEEEWWDKLWTQGLRRWMESLTSEKLETFKNEAFQRLSKDKKPDGIHSTIPVLYAFGT